MIKFELDEDQEKTLKEWQEAIKKIYGEYGLYEYKFTPMGIGDIVKVWSDLAKKELDLTNVNNW